MLNISCIHPFLFFCCLVFLIFHFLLIFLHPSTHRPPSPSSGNWNLRFGLLLRWSENIFQSGSRLTSDFLLDSIKTWILLYFYYTINTKSFRFFYCSHFNLTPFWFNHFNLASFWINLFNLAPFWFNHFNLAPFWSNHFNLTPFWF